MKYIFYIINAVLVIALAGATIGAVYDQMVPDYRAFQDENAERNQPSAGFKKSEPVLNRYQIKAITQRNLFKVAVEKPLEPVVKEDEKSVEALEPTTLKVALWGTVIGQSEPYAVIEDKKQRKQALYQVGDTIQDANIKEILRNKVVLTFQGKDQVLLMEEDVKNKSDSRSAQPPEQLDERPVPPANAVFSRGPSLTPDDLRNQIKFRPHFKSGQVDGLMVYGIRPNSEFRKMGLRNGDIIKEMNGTSLRSAEDASLLLNGEDQGNGKLTILRRGKEKELFFQVEDGRYSIAAPENRSEKTDQNKGEE